jgi:hypothetical protein
MGTHETVEKEPGGDIYREGVDVMGNSSRPRYFNLSGLLSSRGGGEGSIPWKLFIPRE